MFEQISNKSNSNRIEFELHLNKSMEKLKLHYSFRPHYSPRPQWLTGPKPSPNGPNHGLWPAQAAGCAPSAWPVHGYRAVRVQCAWHGTALAVVPVAYQ
jgi:hypothetical protein